MANKEYHIEYWKSSAIEDIDTAYILLNSKKLLQSLFFIHLALEKALKALWVQNNIDNFPPKIHNLTYLYEKAKIELSDTQTDFLQAMNRFQIEGRYPDYLSKLYKTLTFEETKDILNEANILLKCLIEKIHLEQ